MAERKSFWHDVGMTGKLLCLQDVALLLGLSPSTLYGQRLRGENPGALGFRVAGRVRFDPEELNAWIVEQKKEKAWR